MYVSFLLYISHLDLVLTILDNSLAVKEGEDITITCTPSVPTVQVVWDTPVGIEALVNYRDPLHHSITIHNAILNHEGNYSCRVLGDKNVATAMAFVHVRESELIGVKYMHMHVRIHCTPTHFNRMS